MLQGYKAQSEMVLESLDRLIGACEGRRESMVVEGVHLSLNAVIRLMQKHASIVPFLVHISNEAKHRERFAVSAHATVQSTDAASFRGPCLPEHQGSPSGCTLGLLMGGAKVQGA